MVHGNGNTKMMQYTYVLYEKGKDRVYIGYTADLGKRLKDHRYGGVHTTARYKSKELVFYEAFLSEEDARRREKYFKTTKGKKALRFIIRSSIAK